MVSRDEPPFSNPNSTSYIQERIKAAKRFFNDPAEIERIVEMLEQAIKRPE